jgi:magnesium chelatase family protein
MDSVFLVPALYARSSSATLLDRIDLHIEVPAVTAADLILPAPSEGSALVAKRVAAARKRQAARFEALGVQGVASNAACPANLLDKIATPDDAGLTLLRQVVEPLTVLHHSCEGQLTGTAPGVGGALA